MAKKVKATTKPKLNSKTKSASTEVAEVQEKAAEAQVPLKKKIGVVASDKIASRFQADQKFSITRNRGWRGGSGKPK